MKTKTFKYGDKCPTRRRVNKIPKNVAKLPEAPEDKKWVGRGYFPNFCKSTKNREIMYYCSITEKWIKTDFFDCNVFHIELVGKPGKPSIKKSPTTKKFANPNVKEQKAYQLDVTERNMKLLEAMLSWNKEAEVEIKEKLKTLKWFNVFTKNKFNKQLVKIKDKKVLINIEITNLQEKLSSLKN
jgi:hypothetical protein